MEEKRIKLQADSEEKEKILMEEEQEDGSDKFISPMRSIHMVPMDVIAGFEVRP